MQRGDPPVLPDIVCERADGLAVVTGVAHEWVWHSPAGFEWGYGGSGPADLALNILLAATGDRDFAASCHQQFKRDLVGPLPASGGTIPAATVRDWVERRAWTGEGAGK